MLYFSSWPCSVMSFILWLMWPWRCTSKVLIFQLPLVKRCPRMIHLYKKANWDTICGELISISILWWILFTESKYYQGRWRQLKVFITIIMLKLINDHVPAKLLPSRSHCPWLSTSLKWLIRKSSGYITMPSYTMRNLNGGSTRKCSAKYATYCDISILTTLQMSYLQAILTIKILL